MCKCIDECKKCIEVLNFLLYVHLNLCPVGGGYHYYKDISIHTHNGKDESVGWLVAAIHRGIFKFKTLKHFQEPLTLKHTNLSGFCLWLLDITIKAYNLSSLPIIAPLPTTLPLSLTSSFPTSPFPYPGIASCVLAHDDSDSAFL